MLSKRKYYYSPGIIKKLEEIEIEDNFFELYCYIPNFIKNKKADQQFLKIEKEKNFGTEFLALVYKNRNILYEELTENLFEKSSESIQDLELLITHLLKNFEELDNLEKIQIFKKIIIENNSFLSTKSQEEFLCLMALFKSYFVIDIDDLEPIISKFKKRFFSNSKNGFCFIETKDFRGQPITINYYQSLSIENWNLQFNVIFFSKKLEQKYLLYPTLKSVKDKNEQEPMLKLAEPRSDPFLRTIEFLRFENQQNKYFSGALRQFLIYKLYSGPNQPKNE